MPTRGPSIAVAITALLAGPAPGVGDGPVRIVDHHVHVLSPTLVRDWAAVGAAFSRPAGFYATADALLADDGEDPGLRRAVLVPMSHLYGIGEIRSGLDLDLDRERARVAAENDYVAAQASRHPGRTVALCSAPLLRPYAMDEWRRCVERHALPGIKVHLAASGFDPREAEHVDALAAVTRWAAEADLALLLHLDPQRSGVETKDIRRVIDVALAPHPGLRVWIAHLGGSGGYGAWEQSVVATFAEWLESEAARGEPRRGIFFDVSAVVVAEDTARPFAITGEEIAALRRDLRRLGLSRLVFGSDHPVFDPRESARIIRRRVGLAADEVDRILANQIPGLWPDPPATTAPAVTPEDASPGG